MGAERQVPPRDAGAPAPQEPTRREFVDHMLVVALGATAVAAAVPALAYIVPPESGEPEESSVVLPFAAEELQPNSGRIFRFGNEPGMVLRTPSGELRAFAARCTRPILRKPFHIHELAARIEEVAAARTAAG